MHALLVLTIEPVHVSLTESEILLVNWQKLIAISKALVERLSWTSTEGHSFGNGMIMKDDCIDFEPLILTTFHMAIVDCWVHNTGPRLRLAMENRNFIELAVEVLQLSTTAVYLESQQISFGCTNREKRQCCNLLSGVWFQEFRLILSRMQNWLWCSWEGANQRSSAHGHDSRYRQSL